MVRVVCLAGGVGGAKLAEGLQAALGPGELTVIVNTGDDVERHSLTICPDHDTVLYTLAGVAGAEGWGLADETWNVMGSLGRLGEEAWFRLGDRDIATHLLRTERLRLGERLTEVASDLRRRFGVPSLILPMTDDPIRTRVRTDEGWLGFQDYFVRLHQAPEVREVVFSGIEKAHITPEVRDALRSAQAIVVAPSNPIVSIGPILAVPGMLDEIAAARRRGVRSIGISGIIGGKALRGPADRMLTSLGGEASALGVARRYAAVGLLDTFVIDTTDAALADDIRALGLEVIVTDTVMTDQASRAKLARELLAAVATPA
jgi:LPPG:FO 2-phospho-L-lactate transferase